MDARNTFYFYGFAKAYDTVRLLYLAGKNPTRASLMAATRRMNWVNPYAIRGVRVTASAGDRFPISQIRLIRYGNGTWSEFGPLIERLSLRAGVASSSSPTSAKATSISSEW